MADPAPLLDRRASGVPRSARPRKALRAFAPWREPVARAPAEAASPRREPPAKRHLSLLDLVAWVYRDQKAHHYLRREIDWFIQVIDEERLLGDDAPRARVHPDAALVHAAVMQEVRALRRARRSAGAGEALAARLVAAEQKAGLVIHFAELGETPAWSAYDDRPFGWGCDPPTADLPDQGLIPPLPVPVEPLNRKFARYGRARIGGALVDYAILVDDQVTIAEDEWAPAGCRKMKSRTRQVTVPVEYCPVDYVPGSEIVAMTNHIADTWSAAIAELGARLAGAEFRAHVLAQAAA